MKKKYLRVLTGLAVMFGLLVGVSAHIAPEPVAASAQGSFIADGRYVTVTAKNAVSWRSFSWSKLAGGNSLYGQTFLAKGHYRHQNGSTYLSIYDAAGKWHGYINQRSVRVGTAAGQQGSWLSASGYATLTKSAQPIYQVFSKHAVALSDKVLNQTFKVTGEYHWFDGTRYESLYRANGSWLGYLSASSVALTKQAQGTFQAANGWVKVTHSGYQIWKSFSFKTYVRVSNGTTLQVRGVYHHSNGSVYDSVYDGEGHWLGYVNANAVQKTDGSSSKTAADNRYVTISRQGVKVWKDAKLTQAAVGSSLYGKTYHATSQFKLGNGRTYLRLVDNRGNLVGFVAEADVSVAHGPQGSWMAAQGYVSLPERTATYSDFDLKSRKPSKLDDGPRTFQITGKYTTFSGQTLYSLYDDKKAWQGYIDAATVKVSKQATGSKLDKAGYFTTTKAGQPIWSSFFGKHKSTSTYYQQTFVIRGEYVAYTGAIYYSVYRPNGSWLGYLNANNGSFAAGSQGAWMAHDGKVKITGATYPLWRSFYSQQQGTTAALKGKIFSATGMYRDASGDLYYSLYSDGTWQGYVNAKATTAWSNWQSQSGSLVYIDEHTMKPTKKFALKYYSQLDKQWSQVKYSGLTLGKTGCGPATMAMIISGFGQNVTPKMTADYSHAHGTFDRDGAGSLQSDLTLVADHWHIGWHVVSSQSELASYLAKGYPASVCLDFGTFRHIVALTGYNKGYTTVHDPWSGMIYSGKHSLSDIWKRLSWLAGNHNKGASAATVYIGK